MYTYDGLNQLKNMDRGNMVFPYTTPPTIQEATPLVERDFTFDATGNWKGYVEKTSGTTGLNQSRTHNTANEIGTIGASTGTNWSDPTYDRVGNMVTGPKPTSLANSYNFKYDAWNRLVEVKDGATLIGRYEYDGLHRRTKSHIDSQAPSSPNGVDKYRHFFYNSAWQILETRVSNSENTAPETLSAEYQWIWSARYIDSPVLRDKNTDSDGLCDDVRLFYATDGNANVTGLFSTSTLAVERYTYDLYGQVSYYDGNWSAGSSSYDNSILFGGYYQDKESLLCLARLRHLHSWLGRWLQRDPLEYEARDVNLYRYVRASPSGALDPAGLQCATDVFLGHSDYVTGNAMNSAAGQGRPCALVAGVGCGDPYQDSNRRDINEILGDTQHNLPVVPNLPRLPPTMLRPEGMGVHLGVGDGSNALIPQPPGISNELWSPRFVADGAARELIGQDLAVWRYRLLMREFMTVLIQESAKKAFKNRCNCQCWTINMFFQDTGGINAENLLVDVLGDELGNWAVDNPGQNRGFGQAGWTVYWQYTDRTGPRNGITIQVCANSRSAGNPLPGVPGTISPGP